MNLSLLCAHPVVEQEAPWLSNKRTSHVLTCKRKNINSMGLFEEIHWLLFINLMTYPQLEGSHRAIS